MNIALSNKAEKFLDDLQPKQFKQVVARVLDLGHDPRPADMRHMHGHPGYFRITVGEYRVIYRMHEGIVHIVVVGSRNDGDVYREFDRL